MKVPLTNLPLQQAEIADELMAAVVGIIRDAAYVLGSPVQSFESAFARALGASHSVGVASGTDALILALRALDIGRGHGVITTPFSFIATAEAVAAVGAVPIFVDIDEASMCLSATLVEEKLAASRQSAAQVASGPERDVTLRGILPVHLFGHPAPMPPLLRLSRIFGLHTIEDAAQAVLTTSGGRVVGSLGDAAAFSFFPTKNLGGFGDGGAVVTSNELLAARVRSLRQHGMRALYEHAEVGMNSRLDAIQAAVLEVKLRYLEGWTERRISNAARYVEALSGTGDLMLPSVPRGDRHTYHHFVVRTSRRDPLQKWLAARAIESRVYYPLPLHLQPCFQSYGGRRGDFPVAERAAETVLALPVNAELTSDQVDFVIDSVRRFFSA